MRGIGAIFLGTLGLSMATMAADLTPIGAEKGANADGSIPAWTGGELKAPEGWKPLTPRPNPYASEKPLYSVDKSNIAQYKEFLTPGEIELLQTLPGYRLDVYPTHRSCGYPDFVYQRSQENLSTAKLAANGYDMASASPAGFPFPNPKNGTEALWNYKLRWVGEGRIEPNRIVLGPAPGKTELTITDMDTSTFTPFASPKYKTLDEEGKIEFLFEQEVKVPVARTGEITVGRYYTNKINEGWIYMPGLRRIKRLSTYAYDAPLQGMENTYFVDQAWMYNGTLDRYDYKLVGKKEILVPYNTFDLRDGKRYTDKTMFGPHFPNRDAYRYEKHRVWIVEATVKAGQRHAAAKRTFYLDEDTWNILLADLYDAQGKLMRVQEGSLLPAWELGACVNQEYFSYDLNANRYYGDVIVLGEKETDWNAAAEGRLKASRYTESAMQRAGSR